MKNDELRPHRASHHMAGILKRALEIKDGTRWKYCGWVNKKGEVSWLVDNIYWGSEAAARLEVTSPPDSSKILKCTKQI